MPYATAASAERLHEESLGKNFCARRRILSG